jgi:hypothetical protein
MRAGFRAGSHFALPKCGYRRRNGYVGASSCCARPVTSASKNSMVGRLRKRARQEPASHQTLAIRPGDLWWVFPYAG